MTKAEKHPLKALGIGLAAVAITAVVMMADERMASEARREMKRFREVGKCVLEKARETASVIGLAENAKAAKTEDEWEKLDAMLTK